MCVLKYRGDLEVNILAVLLHLHLLSLHILSYPGAPVLLFGGDPWRNGSSPSTFLLRTETRTRLGLGSHGTTISNRQEYLIT